MPADSRDMVEDAARDIWRFFKSEPEWFDANKSLGGPQWLISRLRALSASPARGEGDAPVAWRVLAVEDGRPIGQWSYHADVAWARAHPTLYRIEPLYTRPTPATPEGLREKVVAPDAVEKLFWDWWNNKRRDGEAEAAAFHAGFLAALQPQAEGE